MKLETGPENHAGQTAGRAWLRDLEASADARCGGGLARQGRQPSPTRSCPTKTPGQAAARQLSDEAFQRAWAEGQAMSLEEALAYAWEDA